ncbi:MAG: hypothetical protein ACTSPY_08670 [Candidatus Helarchaeota archaeon]
MTFKDFFLNHKKMLKVFSVIALILIIIPLIGILLNEILFSLILYFFILLGMFGYAGGVWLWKFLARSKEILKMKKYIIIVGIFGLISLFSVMGFSFFMYFQPETILRNQISFLNYLLVFMLFYLFGYDYSIINKDKLHDDDSTKLNSTQNKNSRFGSLFKVDWDIIKKSGLAMVIISLLFFVPLLIIGIYGNLLLIYGNLLILMMQTFMIFLICILGFGIAYIVWEHIKKSDLITGNFKNKLVILSIATTIAVIMLLGYGIYSIYYGGTYFDLQMIVIAISLFIECMAFYFLGLFISTLFIKNKIED